MKGSVLAAQAAKREPYELANVSDEDAQGRSRPLNDWKVRRTAPYRRDSYQRTEGRFSVAEHGCDVVWNQSATIAAQAQSAEVRRFIA